jgi:hypothetical protein
MEASEYFLSFNRWQFHFKISCSSPLNCVAKVDKMIIKFFLIHMRENNLAEVNEYIQNVKEHRSMKHEYFTLHNLENVF